MTETVVDASVVLKWFGGRGERHEEQALAVRSAYAAGRLLVVAPSLLALEIVDVAARHWGWSTPLLQQLAADIDAIGFEWRPPDLGRVARWAGAGLTAYDSAYVALAEEMGAPLVTDDEQILDVAPDLARALSGWDGRNTDEVGPG